MKPQDCFLHRNNSDAYSVNANGNSGREALTGSSRLAEMDRDLLVRVGLGGSGRKEDFHSA